MNKYTVIGLIAWLAGIVMVGFQAIADLMEQQLSWRDISLVDLLGQDKFYWAVDYSWLYSVFVQPIYVVLFGLGLLFIILGVVFWRR